jgi:hypothetical protein
MSTGVDVPGKTTEVLVTSGSAVTLTRIPNGGSVEIVNNGPNTIWLALNGTPVVNKSRPIASGASWADDVPFYCPIQLIASTADQATGAATIVTDRRVKELK